MPPTPTLFDAHLHIIEPGFPLTENNGFLPQPFTCHDYITRMAASHVVGGAVVSGSFQGFDQSYLLHALKRLGRGYVGVTQVPASIADDDIVELHAAGVRAVRFNLKRGGSEDITHLDSLSRRVFELAGWHTELYVDARDLIDLLPTIGKLPAISIDHLGLSSDGLPHLLRLAEQGAKVKATGFGRVDFDVATALRQLYAANPECLMFGTDLPSTRAPRAYRDDDLNLIMETFDETAANKILVANALALYRPASLT